ncbi:MAG TPA: OmpA family protein [Mucilaginibacter sp.]|nr:OmpA family protein [Mucilaginibacter sp.]
MSVGVSAGISTPYTLIGYNSRQDFMSPDMQLGYAVYFKDQLTNSFGLQADLMAGKLKADHSSEKFSNGEWIYEQFTSKINWSASLNGNFTIFHWGLAQPYLTTGGGILSYSPVVYPSRPSEVVPVYNTLNNFFVPIGLGLKVNVTDDINVDIGYQVNFVMADNVDGYKYGPTNDRFSYSHIGLEFAIGDRSKKQLAAQSVSVPVQNRALAREQVLQDEMQSLQTRFDAEKEKNVKLTNDAETANASVARLMTDSDGDGVPDVNDKCPDTPPNTKVDASGCPLNIPLVATDGIKPEIAKPEVSEEDKRKLLLAGASLEFYTGTEILNARSFPNLDAVVRLLAEKKLSLKIDVYTTKNVGTNRDLQLARLRANAVKNYFVSRGINGSRVVTDGHAGFPPDARRHQQFNSGIVEFTLLQ